jgi:two-component system, cell cycle response regulator DivK
MDGKSILYIEDNIDNRVLIRRLLNSEGFEVIEAGSAAEGIGLLNSIKPDLILMDINMPDQDGYSLTAQIRRMPGFAEIPIVALTANVMRGDRERSLEAGCDGYIQKPIDIDIFPQQIERYIQRKSSRFTFPIVVPIPTPQAPVQQATTIPAECNILVVEDNVSNFVLIARMLNHLGIHCEWKTSGYEVVEFADTMNRIDLILMDIRLPYENGYSALNKIRASERLKDVPIIAVTAEASKEEMDKARASGFSGFLGKPLDPDRFPNQIINMLNGIPVWEIS